MHREATNHNCLLASPAADCNAMDTVKVVSTIQKTVQ